MNTFDNFKKKTQLSIKLKLLIFAITILFGFVAFIVLECMKNPPFSPIGFGFTVFFMLFGVVYFFFSIFTKDLSGYVAGAIALTIGLVLLLAIIVEVKWYITVISAVVLFTILVVLLFAIVTPKLVVYGKNEDPEYKDYKQRREEAKANAEPQEEEELPEIKSFKE